MRSIEVTALPSGWRVSVDQVANDMIFRSGRAAESAAVRLGERLARAGQPSEIRLFLRDGSPAGRLRTPVVSTTREQHSHPPPKEHVPRMPLSA